MRTALIFLYVLHLAVFDPGDGAVATGVGWFYHCYCGYDEGATTFVFCCYNVIDVQCLLASCLNRRDGGRVVDTVLHYLMLLELVRNSCVYNKSASSRSRREDGAQGDE